LAFFPQDFFYLVTDSNTRAVFSFYFGSLAILAAISGNDIHLSRVCGNFCDRAPLLLSSLE